MRWIVLAILLVVPFLTFAQAGASLTSKDVFIDCDSNGIPDEEQIASEPWLDCNDNSVIDTCEISGLVRLGSGEAAEGEWYYGASVNQDYAFLTTDSGGVAVYDVSDAFSPTLITTIPIPGRAFYSLVVDSYLYVAAYNTGLHVVDISDILNSSIVGSIGHTNILRLFHEGDYLYAPKEAFGLSIYYIGDRTTPIEVGHAFLSGSASGVVVRDGLAYVSVRLAGLDIVDVQDPTNPHVIGNVDTDTKGLAPALYASYVLQADTGSVPVIDISDPTAPFILTSFSFPGNARNITIVGNRAYISADSGGVYVYDLTDIDMPSQVAHVDTPSNAYMIAIHDNDVVLACSQYGMLTYSLLGIDTDSNGILDSCDAQFQVDTVSIGGSSQSTAWSDCDGDGDDDLYISRRSVPNILMQNNGPSGFLDVTPEPLASESHATSTIWLDVYNNGLLDGYTANLNEPNFLIHNIGEFGFLENTPPPLDDPGPSQGLSAADYDLDGDLDVFIARSSAQPNLLVRNDGVGIMTDVSSGPILDPRSSFMGCWADYDNDGDPDLYVANWGTANQLLRNDGNDVFLDIAFGPFADSGNANGLAWGDYDNDGWIDLYITCFNTPNILLHNERGLGFTDATIPGLDDPGPSTSPYWIDFDNDGWLDLYFASAPGPNRLFHNNQGTFLDISTMPLSDAGNHTSVGWSDFDDDGDMDVFLADWDPDGTSLLLRNELNSDNHWLEIDLHGVASNRYGVGTRIRVVTGSASQIREVSIGSGSFAQHSLTAHFGLGAYSVADTVELRWHSGTVQIITDLTADQRVRILESDVSTPAPPSPIARLTLRQNSPNPFNPSTTISFTLTSDMLTRLDIFDVSGRHVSTLVDSVIRAGEHDVRWDGRDAAGAQVSSGVYLYRLRAGEFVETKRMVLLK